MNIDTINKITEIFNKEFPMVTHPETSNLYPNTDEGMRQLFSDYPMYHMEDTVEGMFKISDPFIYICYPEGGIVSATLDDIIGQWHDIIFG
jgi:hypothetical protein